MIALLAPSKTMNFDPAPEWVESLEPLFPKEAARIATTIKNLDGAGLKRVMNSSPAICQNVRTMYEQWGRSAPKKAALWAYRGDVYKGMYADKLTAPDAEWAQEHILILSGLYGLVRPFDAISPYRLEMKAPLAIESAKNLYEFWGNRLARYVVERANGIVCNLSSDEYARVVLKHVPSDIQVITPIFYDNRPSGKVGSAPIYNKMMRGVLARWMIDHKIDTPAGLRKFTGHSYRFDASRSTPDAPAFYRPTMKPLVF